MNIILLIDGAAQYPPHVSAPSPVLIVAPGSGAETWRYDNLYSNILYLAYIYIVYAWILLYVYFCLSEFLLKEYQELTPLSIGVLSCLTNTRQIYFITIRCLVFSAAMLGCMHRPAHSERLPSSNTIVNSTPRTSNTNVTQSSSGSWPNHVWKENFWRRK